MSAGQNPNFTANGTNLVESTSIEAFALLHDEAADRLLLDVVKCVLLYELGDLFRPELFNEL